MESSGIFESGECINYRFHKEVRYPKTACVTLTCGNANTRTHDIAQVRSKRSTMVHRVSRLGNTLELKSVLARVRSLGSTWCQAHTSPAYENLRGEYRWINSSHRRIQLSHLLESLPRVIAFDVYNYPSFYSRFLTCLFNLWRWFNDATEIRKAVAIATSSRWWMFC